MNIFAGVACINVTVVELAERANIPLSRGTLNLDVDLTSDVFVIVVVIAVIVSDVVAPVSYTVDIRAGVMTDALTGTVVSAVLANGINALTGADVNMWAAPMPVSSEKTLPLRRGASSCWPAAASDSCALQA